MSDSTETRVTPTIAPQEAFITGGMPPERKYYLVRSCREIPFADGVVGVGWDWKIFKDFPDAEALLRQMKPEDLGRRANQIRRFKAIRKGDVIVVPYSWGAAAICEALGEENYDLRYYDKWGCNQQRVRFPLGPDGQAKLQPRRELSEALQRRLKIQMTVVDLGEFKEELDRTLANLDAGRTHSWSAEKAKKEDALPQKMKDQLLGNIRAGETGLRSGGIGLEHLVKELLQIDGFDARVLGKRTFKGSGDADIKASKTDRLHSEEFLVQVKLNDGETDRKGQHQLLEIPKLMPEYADCRLVLVTSGDIRDEDRKFAKENDITLIEGPELVDWIYESIPKLSQKTKLALGISEVPRVLA